MIQNEEIYIEFLLGIIKKMSILKTEQLSRALYKTYQGMNRKIANNVLSNMQDHGSILLSPDGWAMTKGTYASISGDKLMENILNKSQFRIPPMDRMIKDYGISMDAIECLWIVIDMLPDSIDFVVNKNPWFLLFDTQKTNEDVSKLYEITRIPKNKEEARIEMLRAVSVTKEPMRQSIVRIALIDDEKHSWMVPHIGFSYICVLDDNAKSHFKVIEKRTGENLWDE